MVFWSWNLFSSLVIGVILAGLLVPEIPVHSFWKKMFAAPCICAVRSVAAFLSGGVAHASFFLPARPFRGCGSCAWCSVFCAGLLSVLSVVRKSVVWHHIFHFPCHCRCLHGTGMRCGMSSRCENCVFICFCPRLSLSSRAVAVGLFGPFSGHACRLSVP